jgi:MYXO-CTERM domain-containing protein
MLASSFAADGRTIATAVITLTGTKVHIMRNNIGFPSKNSNMTGVDTANNSWDLGITPAASDFASNSDTGCTGPRNADGSIPAACTYLKLTAGSKMIDKGVDVGLPFVGAAPDLGAYEFGAVTTGAGGTPGGNGGGPGSGGSPGTGGSPGSGGSTRNDASAGSGGSTRSDASAGNGGSIIGNGGSVGNGGSIGSGGSTGTGSGGSTGTGSGGSTASGGASTAGTTGTTGGATGTGGRVIAATGGATAAGGIIGTGGASQGNGGNIVAATGGSASGGAAGTGGAPGTGVTGGSSAGITSSGCGCAVGSRSPRSGMAAFLMVGALALLARRRRNRI